MEEKKKTFWKMGIPRIPGSAKPIGEPKSPTTENCEQEPEEENQVLNSPIVETAQEIKLDDNFIYPDVSDSSLEDKIQNVTLEDGKLEKTDDKNTMRIKKFQKLYQATNVDLNELKTLSWPGIPSQFRPWAWKLLLGYVPLNKERRLATLERKRQEYIECVKQCFGDQTVSEYANVDFSIFTQIQKDVPRTCPDVKLFHSPIVRKSLERILYVWALRHPASGYVQGINDLLTPFYVVFLSSYIEGDIEACVPTLEKDILDLVEADSYWCLSKLVDGIQDNYTVSQPGIQRQVFKLKELIGRVDAQLQEHLQEQGIEFIQFAFRWMNCLLLREITLKNIIRMWDTYMAEGMDGYSTFHLYVCAAFLISWSKELKKMDFAEIMTFLQCPPTQKWETKEIELILAEAFLYKSLFQNAQSHLHQ